LNCRFSNKYAFHVQCAYNCASFVWKCDRQFSIYSAPCLEIELSLPWKLSCHFLGNWVVTSKWEEPFFF